MHSSLTVVNSTGVVLSIRPGTPNAGDDNSKVMGAAVTNDAGVGTFPHIQALNLAAGSHSLSQCVEDGRWPPTCSATSHSLNVLALSFTAKVAHATVAFASLYTTDPVP